MCNTKPANPGWIVTIRHNMASERQARRRLCYATGPASGIRSTPRPGEAAPAETLPVQGGAGGALSSSPPAGAVRPAQQTAAGQAEERRGGPGRSGLPSAGIRHVGAAAEPLPQPPGPGSPPRRHVRAAAAPPMTAGTHVRRRPESFGKSSSLFRRNF